MRYCCYDICGCWTRSFENVNSDPRRVNAIIICEEPMVLFIQFEELHGFK